MESTLAASLALIVNGSGFVATGILISQTVVAFSAFLTVTTDDRVYVGRTDVPALDAPRSLSVRSVDVHPRFAGGAEKQAEHSLAYLTVGGDLPSGAVPVAVNVDRSLPQPNAIVRAVGYGSVSGDVYYNPGNVLRYVDMPLFNFSRCMGRFSPSLNWSEVFLFCAGYRYGGCSDW